MEWKDFKTVYFGCKILVRAVDNPNDLEIMNVVKCSHKAYVYVVLLNDSALSTEIYCKHLEWCEIPK